MARLRWRRGFWGGSARRTAPAGRVRRARQGQRRPLCQPRPCAGPVRPPGGAWRAPQAAPEAADWHCAVLCCLLLLAGGRLLQGIRRAGVHLALGRQSASRDRGDRGGPPQPRSSARLVLASVRGPPPSASAPGRCSPRPGSHRAPQGQRACTSHASTHAARPAQALGGASEASTAGWLMRVCTAGAAAARPVAAGDGGRRRLAWRRGGRAAPTLSSGAGGPRFCSRGWLLTLTPQVLPELCMAMAARL